MKLRSLIMLGLILVVMSVAPASGAAPAALDLPTIADDVAHITNIASPFLNTETNLWVGGSKVQASDPCGETLETFLKFNLSSVPANETIDSATLTLKSNGILANSTELTMRLFGSSNTGWSEGLGQIADWASRPAPSTDLASVVTGLTPAGTNIVFNSTADFLKYLNDQLKTDAGKLATLVIVTTACNSPASRQYLSSKETTGANAFVPTLSVTSSVPTAVTLSTLHAADDPAVNWPLIVGLGALAAVVIGGLAVTRRRAAGR